MLVLLDMVNLFHPVLLAILQTYSWPDVLASIANYLRRNGYTQNSNNYDKNGDIWKAIYAYNHADNYVMAVLELTKEIRARATQ